MIEASPLTRSTEVPRVRPDAFWPRARKQGLLGVSGPLVGAEGTADGGCHESSDLTG